jgi:hypothetical protein
MNSPLLTRIYQAHLDRLGDRLVAVILCGSASEGTAGDDVDYVVLLRSLSGEAYAEVVKARAELAREYGIDMSNTVISRRDYNRYLVAPNTIDGKAAQALIEAAGRPERVLSRDGFRLNLPALDVVSNFSVQNFFTLRKLVLKMIARSAEDQSPATGKLAKICLIALKMKLQHAEPRLFMKQTVAQAYVSGRLSVQDKANYEMLSSIKYRPVHADAVSDITQLLKFLDSTVVLFAAEQTLHQNLALAQRSN